MHHPRLAAVNPQVHRDSAPQSSTSNHFKCLLCTKSSAQITCKLPLSVKGSSFFLQPRECSLTITVNRRHASQINIERTRRAHSHSQVFCRRALESAAHSDRNPGIMTN